MVVQKSKKGEEGEGGTDGRREGWMVLLVSSESEICGL